MFSALDLAVSEFACFDQIVLIAQEVLSIFGKHYATKRLT